MPHSYAQKVPFSFCDHHETHNIYFAQAPLCVYIRWLALVVTITYAYMYMYAITYVYVYMYMYVFMYVYTHIHHYCLVYIFMYVSFILIYMSLLVCS
jgi:hypothetical protein